eukprot:54359-Eustigmatos_ZCMA.PRE.1
MGELYQECQHGHVDFNDCRGRSYLWMALLSSQGKILTSYCSLVEVLSCDGSPHPGQTDYVNRQMQPLCFLCIKYPWAQRILDGDKTIETRSYDMSIKLKGKIVVLYETGQPHRGVSLAVGAIQFGTSQRYESQEDWRADIGKHLVEENDKEYGWNPKKAKFGWSVKGVARFAQPFRIEGGAKNYKYWFVNLSDLPEASRQTVTDAFVELRANQASSLDVN